jgi:uncharacterized protein YgbK (DUF1537 family)
MNVSNVMTQKVRDVRKEIGSLVETYNENSDAVHRVKANADAAKTAFKTFSKRLEQVRERLLNEARGNVKRRQWVNFACNALSKLASVIPVGLFDVLMMAGGTTAFEFGHKSLDWNRKGHQQWR